MNMKILVICTCCALAFLTGSFSTFAIERENSLKEKRITIKMEKQPLGVVFHHLMKEFDVQIGFEQSILDRTHTDYAFDTNLPVNAIHKQQFANDNITLTTTSETAFTAKLRPITVVFENEKLEIVIDQIVKQMENYRWELNDNVVNIIPTKGRDQRFAKLLNLQVKKFTLEGGKTIEDITTKIILLPEFRSFMTENRLSFDGIRTGVDFAIKARYGKAIEKGVEFEGLTFRDLLNSITKVKKGGWIVKWRYVSKLTGKELVDIDI